MLETSREISKRLKIFVRIMFVTCVLMLNPSLVAEDYYSDISVEGKQSIQHESEFNSHEPINGFGLPTDRPDYVGGLYDSRLDYLSFSSDELEDLLKIFREYIATPQFQMQVVIVLHLLI